jgi:hypothetical protein
VQAHYPEESATYYVQAPTYATEIEKRQQQAWLSFLISDISLQPAAELTYQKACNRSFNFALMFSNCSRQAQ